MIVHDACKTGGIGAEIGCFISEEALDYLDAPIRRVACLDTLVPYNPELEKYVFPSVDDIIKAVGEIT